MEENTAFASDDAEGIVVDTQATDAEAEADDEALVDELINEAAAEGDGDDDDCEDEAI